MLRFPVKRPGAIVNCPAPETLASLFMGEKAGDRRGGKAFNGFGSPHRMAFGGQGMDHLAHVCGVDITVHYDYPRGSNAILLCPDTGGNPAGDIGITMNSSPCTPPVYRYDGFVFQSWRRLYCPCCWRESLQNLSRRHWDSVHGRSVWLPSPIRI